eukprot:jgi/Botrbrau1/14978/Bobra.0018s0078.1
MGLSQKTAQSIPKILVFWDDPKRVPKQFFWDLPKNAPFFGTSQNFAKFSHNSPKRAPKRVPKASRKTPIYATQWESPKKQVPKMLPYESQGVPNLSHGGPKTPLFGPFWDLFRTIFSTSAMQSMQCNKCNTYCMH